MARPFRLVDQVNLVSFEFTNLQEKLQKGSVHVNRMKQYFTCDDPPIDSPRRRNSTGNPPEDDHESLELFTDSHDNRVIELVDGILPNNAQHDSGSTEQLKEINTLPELMKSSQLKQQTKSSQDIDNHFGINTLPNYAINHGKQSVTHLREENDFSNNLGQQQARNKDISTNHFGINTLRNCVFNRANQSVTRSKEENGFNSNHDQQKHEDIATNTPQTFSSDNDIYLVEQVRKHRHRNGKLEFLIKWLGYSKPQNT